MQMGSLWTTCWNPTARRWNGGHQQELVACVNLHRSSCIHTYAKNKFQATFCDPHAFDFKTAGDAIYLRHLRAIQAQYVVDVNLQRTPPPPHLQPSIQADMVRQPGKKITTRIVPNLR